MKNFSAIIALISRANSEIGLHQQFIRSHPYGESGHKTKAKRAITMAREMLLEESKLLDKKE